MNRLLTILLLLGATAHGQIANPPTTGSIGLGPTNDVTFNRVVTTSLGSTTNPAIRIGASNTGFYSPTNGYLYLLVNDNFVIGADDQSINFSRDSYFYNTITVYQDASVGGTLAVTGNVTLSGVNNTMPNATDAASGSSLMTRDLIYPENVRENSGDMIFPFSSVAVGGSAGSYITAGNQAQITTTTNSYAGCYFGEAIAYQAAYSGSPMQSLKVMDLTMKGVMLSMETNANYVLRVAAGVGTPTRVDRKSVV